MKNKHVKTSDISKVKEKTKYKYNVVKRKPCEMRDLKFIYFWSLK